MSAISYDTETTGLHPHQGDSMFAFSTSDKRLHTLVKRVDYCPDLQSTQGIRHLQRIWDDKNTSEYKVMFNAKFDLTMTELFLGRQLTHHKFHCVHKMCHILQNNHYSHRLEDWAWDLFEIPKDLDKKVSQIGHEYGGYQNVPIHYMNKYQRLDATRTILLYAFAWPKIKQNKKWLYNYQVERDLIAVTMRMEERGVPLNVRATNRLISKLEYEVEEANHQFWKLAQYRLNPRSDTQIRHYLFDILKLPKTSKLTDSKQPSVDKYAMMELRELTKNPIIDLILKIRSFSKGITTLEKYLELMDAEGVLHPEINTCAAKTAREGCSHPNLQNVSKSEVLLNPYPIPARLCFMPRPDYINIHIDYKGIEMRLLVHYSHDPLMIDCLNNGDGDVHRLAAEVFYGNKFKRLDPKSKLYDVYRSASKNANFACPYGAGAPKIAKTLGLPEAEGFRAFDRYQKTFPTLVNLNRTISQWVKRDGYVESVFGRHLYVPYDTAYVGTNYLIQHTGAMVLKVAQNRIHEFNVREMNNEVFLILPIHDEIIIEYPIARLSELGEYLFHVRRLMIDFDMFDVPLEVDAKAVGGHNASWETKGKLTLPATRKDITKFSVRYDKREGVLTCH